LVVAAIGNNGHWAHIKRPQKKLLGHSASDLAPDIRYDKMMEALAAPAPVRPGVPT
jgi:thiamine pyrophosphate-dependent acetolactate synthase large subunit-like protein